MCPKNLHQHCRQWLLGLIALLVIVCNTAIADQPPPNILIQQAHLHSLAGERLVSLPSVLNPADYTEQGSDVQYQLFVNLDNLPQHPLALYVPKLSLAGSVSINGKYLEACAVGPIEQLRCLHRPYLFVVPADFWRVGNNSIRFDIYATPRQMNGLSSVTLGEPAALYEHQYRWEYWLRVDLLMGLAWLSAISGLLSLCVALALRREAVYLWFGLTCIANALSLFNGFVESPNVPINIYNWFVFSMRLISVPMLCATFIALFGRNQRWFSALVVFFSIAAPIAIWLSNNNRQLVTALYIPWLLIAPVLMVAMLRWAQQSQQRIFWVYALALPTQFLCGIYDWLRLGGQTRFEGVFLVPYSSTLVLLIIWGIIINDLVRSIQRERALRASLETRIAEKNAYERARAQDRERLLQDMHDGFGSQLAGLSLMAEQGHISPSQLPDYLKELMSDLYLVVDTLSSDDITFEDALIDMRYRLQSRVQPGQTQIQWRIELAALPKIPQRTVLHILRVIQEALNNALKHAQATEIAINAIYEQATHILTVSIKDNGRGLPDNIVHGRGLYNMRTRAREAGAEFVLNHHNGVEIMLRLDTRTAGQIVSD